MQTARRTILSFAFCSDYNQSPGFGDYSGWLSVWNQQLAIIFITIDELLRLSVTCNPATCGNCSLSVKDSYAKERQERWIPQMFSKTGRHSSKVHCKITVVQASTLLAFWNESFNTVQIDIHYNWKTSLLKIHSYISPPQASTTTNPTTHRLFDLYVDERLALARLSVDAPGDVLVDGHALRVDLEVGRARLEDLLLGVELRVRLAGEAGHLDGVAGLRVSGRGEDFNLVKKTVENVVGKCYEQVLISIIWH